MWEDEQDRCDEHEPQGPSARQDNKLAEVLAVAVDDDEPSLALVECVLRSGGVTAFHARAVVSRDLELRPDLCC